MSTDEFRYSDRPDDTSDDDEEFIYPGAEESQPFDAPSFSGRTSPAPTTSTPSAAQLESITAAASSGDLELLKKLFSHAAQQSQVQRFSLANEASPRTGLTALHVAASKGHEDIVKWVIEECGALPNLEDREGETALHKASLNGHLSILQYLLPNRADVHARDNDGWTSLHNAASKGYLDIVRFLCESGGATDFLDSGERGVDVRNTIGWTALMNAASKGHIPVVRYLLTKHNADPLIRNNWGETAYDVSAAVFEIYICDLLQSAELAVFSNNGLVDLYDPLAVHTTVPCVLYENQRIDSRLKTLAMNGGKAKFSASGLRTSSHMGPAQSQSSRHAFELRVPGTIDKVVGAWRSDVQLPFMDDPFKLPQPGKGSTTAEGRERSCFWLSDWTIDTTHPSYDPNSGWAYAPSFTVPENDWSPSIPESPGSTASSSSTSPPPQKYVRRRRWVRLLRRRLDIPPLPFLQPDGRYYMLTTDGDLVLRDNVEEGVMVGQVQGEDYVSVARRLVGQNDWVTGDDDVGGLRRTVMKLERAVDALRSGIIGDGDAERRTQAEVLLNAYSRELERKKDEAKTRGVQIVAGNDDELLGLLDASSDDDDEEFVYPGAGPSSPSPRGGGTPRPGSRAGSIMSSSDYFTTRPISRSTTSSRLATDLTPHLSHAPEFRVPTHEAPPTASQSTSSEGRVGNSRRRPEWEKDDTCTTCRGCQRRFTFILRRHHCRRCGKIYCDKCSSWRAVLDPDEIVHEPSIAASIPEGDSTPPLLSRTVHSRVCQECFIEVSGGRVEGSPTSSNFDLGYGRGMLERIVIDRGRLYPRTTSFGRGRSSSQLSDLAECPVCNTSLDNVGSIAQQEAHVKNCLEGGNVNGATSVQSAKYLVYTLPETSALIGVECVICLEEFLKGSSVARLSCFCSFHTSCLTSWLQRGKACPVHSR